jgi:hypothetical protein
MIRYCLVQCKRPADVGIISASEGKVKIADIPIGNKQKWA